MSVFQTTYRVSFGDCDPAGIVFYPNIFAWLDRTFHLFLTEYGGGHAALCDRLGAKGIGLTDASCRFRIPVTEGDDLTVSVEGIEWTDRTFAVSYDGRVSDAVVFKATETRAQFVVSGGRMTAGDLAELKSILSAD